jgi:hypothetical protein
MKRTIGRRDVVAGLIDQLRAMHVEYPSTRSGKAAGTFHVDGTNLVGRGRVDATPMERAELEEIHATVFTGLNRRWVHFSYGGYTPETVTFGRFRGIALFEFDENSTLTPLTPAARRMWRATTAGRKRRKRLLTAWAAMIVLALGMLAFLFQDQAARIGVFAFWTVVVVVVVVIVGSIMELQTTPQRKTWWW